MDRKINHTKHDFACVMLFFDMPAIEYIHTQLADKDIYIGEDNTFGIECCPHVSLLMGIHGSVCGEKVIETVQQFDFHEFIISNASTFPARTECAFEVLKFDVEYPELYNINADLRSKYPYTTSFEYHPHCTIAYLKKGTATKYTDLLKNVVYEAVPKKIVYSFKDILISVNV